jgi:hypothetical protein
VDRFERANMPSVPPEEKRRILSFIVVGGGPTGVEFSGEFSDFLKKDLAKVNAYVCVWVGGCVYGFSLFQCLSLFAPRYHLTPPPFINSFIHA